MYEQSMLERAKPELLRVIFNSTVMVDRHWVHSAHYWNESTISFKGTKVLDVQKYKHDTFFPFQKEHIPSKRLTDEWWRS